MPEIPSTGIFTPLGQTADSQNGFVTSASQYWSSCASYRAFNSLVASPWLWVTDDGLPQWLKIDIGSGNSAICSNYSVRGQHEGGYADRQPKDWKLQGSNNDSDWDDLDTVTGETGWAASEEREFVCDVVTTAYRYFRINITANNGDATTTTISILKLYGSKTNLIDTDIRAVGGSFEDLLTEVSATIPRIDINTSIEATSYFLQDLNTDIEAEKRSYSNLNVYANAKAPDGLLTYIDAGAENIQDLNVYANAKIFDGLLVDIAAHELIIVDLSTDVRAMKTGWNDLKTSIVRVRYPEWQTPIMLSYRSIPTTIGGTDTRVNRQLQLRIFNPDPHFDINVTSFKISFNDGATEYEYGDPQVAFHRVNYREVVFYVWPPIFGYEETVKVEVYCEYSFGNPGLLVEKL